MTQMPKSYMSNCLLSEIHEDLMTFEICHGTHKTSRRYLIQLSAVFVMPLIAQLSFVYKF